MKVTERLLALSKQLMQAIESGQEELVGTLLAERQQLTQSLGSGSVSLEEKQALQESDQVLCRLAQGVRDQLGREIQVSHQRQRLQAHVVLGYAPQASFLDQFG